MPLVLWVVPLVIKFDEFLVDGIEIIEFVFELG